MKYETVRLGDICNTNTNSYSLNEKWKYVNYLDTGNITENKIDNIQYIDLSSEKLPSRARRKVSENDIIFSTVRPNQLHYGFIKEIPDNFLVSTGFTTITANEKICFPKYLYYFLTQNYIINYLHAIAEQSTSAYPSIKSSDIEDLKIKLPELSVQKQIASILSALDDKIELNNRINKNLEEQTQAIFKSWFVEFEPFCGVMPNDWKITTLGEVCSCILGGTPSRKNPEYWNGNISWINSGEVNRFRITSPSELITEKGLNSSSTKLLPEKTTVLAITGATLGKVSLLEIESCANQSVVGIIPNEILPYEYIFPFIKANIKQLTLHQTGGAQQHINKQNVESLPVYIPYEEDIKKYKNIVNSIYEVISNNCFENQRLSALRDALLPELMNGEIDVSKIKD